MNKPTKPIKRLGLIHMPEETQEIIVRETNLAYEIIFVLDGREFFLARMTEPDKPLVFKSLNSVYKRILGYGWTKGFKTERSGLKSV